MKNPIGRKRSQHAFIISLDIYEKEFEDTQAVTRIRTSTKNRQHNNKIVPHTYDKMVGPSVDDMQYYNYEI